MLQPGRSAPANATLAGGYRFGYNGKEKDNNGEFGLTNYDYGFRIYNPGLGRFLSVDPLVNSYPWYTPFQFAGNSPVSNIDIDGLEEMHFNLTYNKARRPNLTLVVKNNGEEVLQIAIGGMNKNKKGASGDALKKLTEVAERTARELGVNKIEIEFGMVFNPKLKGEAGIGGGAEWAAKYGYEYSKEVSDVGLGTSVFWKKTL